MLFCVQNGTCPVCRQSLTAVDDTAGASAADAGSEMMSSSSQQDDTEFEPCQENLSVVTVAMETALDVQLPDGLSPNTVIDDVEYFETEAIFSM